MPEFEKSQGFKMKGFSGFGNSPLKAKKKKYSKKDDEFGKIKKDRYPNLVEDITPVQEDKKGLYVTGKGKAGNIHSIGPDFESDTTRFPKGFSTYEGKIKKGDLIDETAWDAWSGVDVSGDYDPYKGPAATGKRKVYNKKTGKYEDYKK
tara:strand:- start:579 stop:1025 length:447 start_codon:yes stop_codon:yes gene_type:complete